LLLAGLTALQLGGLPKHPAPATLKLQSLRRLTTHIKVSNTAQPTHPQLGSLQALAAFPSLTRLELTGMIGPAALQQLSGVAPPQLQELLLPQRLWRVGWSDLAALQVGGCAVYMQCSRWQLAVCLGYKEHQCVLALDRSSGVLQHWSSCSSPQLLLPQRLWIGMP
jgi:hypothetical protein